MNIWHKKIISFFKDEDAQAMVEYVLLAALFILVSYIIIKLMFSAWKIKFNTNCKIRAGSAGVLP